VSALHAPRFAPMAKIESPIGTKHGLEQTIRNEERLGAVLVINCSERSSLDGREVIDAMANDERPHRLHRHSSHFDELAREILRRARVASTPEVIEHPGILAHRLLGVLAADAR